MEPQNLKILIDSTQEAIKRARFALFLCILAAGASFICLWNTYASWDRTFGTDPTPGLLTFSNTLLDPSGRVLIDCGKQQGGISLLDADKKAEDAKEKLKSANKKVREARTPIDLATATKDLSAADKENAAAAYAQTLADGLLKKNTVSYLQQGVFRNWVDSQYVTISLLGIRFSVSDFAVLDSLALYLFVLYYMLAMRRENHETGKILHEVIGQDPETKTTVYRAIKAYMVFNLSPHSDAPIENYATSDPPPVKKYKRVRFAVEAMHWAPAVVIGLTIVCDFCSVFIPSGKFGMLFSSPFHPDGTSIWQTFPIHRDRLIYFAFVELTALAILLMVCDTTNKTPNYKNRTSEMLDKFEKDELAANKTGATQ